MTADEKLDTNLKLECWICGGPGVGVASSPLGAISGAYCKECLATDREPWFVLVGGLYGCKRGEAAEWVKPVIEATLAFYEKTEDDLWDAIEKMDADYEERCRKEAKGDA